MGLFSWFFSFSYLGFSVADQSVSVNCSLVGIVLLESFMVKMSISSSKLDFYKEVFETRERLILGDCCTLQ